MHEISEMLGEQIFKILNLIEISGLQVPGVFAVDVALHHTNAFADDIKCSMGGEGPENALYKAPNEEDLSRMHAAGHL